MNASRCGAHPEPLDIISSEAVAEIAKSLRSAADDTESALKDVTQQWGALVSAFQVVGAEGVHSMMVTPQQDAQDLARALRTAADKLDGHAKNLAETERRRDRLKIEYSDVLAEHERLSSALATAQNAWDFRKQTDPIEPGQRTKPREWHVYMSAKEDWERHLGREQRVGRANLDFNLQVEADEQRLATDLRGVEGGERVEDTGGRSVTSVGSPAARAGRVNVADALQKRLVDGAIEHMTTMSTWSPDAVARWTKAHPSFTSVVPLIPAERAVELWESWAKESAYDSTARGGEGVWATGPLSVFFTAAPALVGNLSGVASSERRRFNEAALVQALNEPGLDEDQRIELRNVADAVRDDGTLLTFFIDTSGEARAAVAYGDVDDASLIVTLTHGIQTDLTQSPDWLLSAAMLREDVREELNRTGLGGPHWSSSIATVAYFGWDSGTTDTVVRSDLPFAGARGYANFVEGLKARNPDVKVEGWFHSFGTTMASETIALAPGALDGVHNFGSAGYREDTRVIVEEQIRQGYLRVDSTHSDRDWTAGLGRRKHLIAPLVDFVQGVSFHDVDPRDVIGGGQFSAADGSVEFAYPNSGARGRTVDTVDTEGHGSHRHADPIQEFLWGNSLDPFTYGAGEGPPDGEPRFPQDGYLSRRSTAYQQAFADVVARYYDLPEKGK